MTGHKSQLLKCLTLLFLFAGTAVSRANEFILLHTNDVHGLIENSVYNESIGGYARLKAVFNRERALAHEKGLPTLSLDGGDFLEGSIFYMADKAKRVLSAHSQMDYSAVALGNHDWLMGANDLSELLGSVDFSFDLLAANLEFDTKKMPGLKKIKPYKLMTIAGRKVAILGLTTNEYYYKWALKGCRLLDPIKAAKKWSKKLKAMGVETIIAVTHLGVQTDIELVQKTEDIDLVVGGHSHSLLVKPVMQRNKAGRLVGIVQAGEHAEHMGKLHLRIKPDGRLEILKHENIEIKEIDGDEVMKEVVSEVRTELNKVYGPESLSEIVGTSEVDLTNTHYEMSVWNMFLTDAFKEALNADIAIHAPALAGVWLKKGPISHEKVIQSYPRYFSLDDKRGWRLYKISIYGGVAKLLMEFFLKSDEAIALSGVSFKIEESGGKKKIRDFKVGKEPIKFFKKYTIAMPEGVIKGGLGATGILLELLHAVERTEINLWQAIEDKMKRMGTIPADYLSRRETRPSTPKSSALKSLDDESPDYVFFPRKK